MADGRHVSQKSRIKPAYLVAGGVGALALIAGLVVVLTGGSDSPLIPGNSPATSPTFAFEVTRTVPVTTVLLKPEESPPDLQKSLQAAKPATANAEKTMHALYSNAFLVPENWTNDSYEDVFTAFAAPARVRAIQQIDVLTAGSAAGETYSAIEPAKATMRTKVLLDPKGQPASAVSTVTFTADATLKDGSGTMTIVSKGQYVFEKTARGWQITAFSVQRSDQAPKGSASGAAAGSASGSASEAA